MLNWECLLLGSLGSSQFGFLIKYEKLQCEERTTTTIFCVASVGVTKREKHNSRKERKREKQRLGELDTVTKRCRGSQSLEQERAHRKDEGGWVERQGEREEEDGQHSEHDCLAWN